MNTSKEDKKLTAAEVQEVCEFFGCTEEELDATRELPDNKRLEKIKDLLYVRNLEDRESGLEARRMMRENPDSFDVAEVERLIIKANGGNERWVRGFLKNAHNYMEKHELISHEEAQAWREEYSQGKTRDLLKRVFLDLLPLLNGVRFEPQESD